MENIWNFLDRFVDEIKSGKRMNGNNRYTAGSCKAWSSFRKLYNGFDPRHRLTWTDVDCALVTKFLDHLQKLDYMGSSVNKYLVSFRAMVGYAYEDGLQTVR
ncbi:phage integrase SAM-like domain-containing protein [Bacteroides caecimuris]|uniref:phage integrase SAM-like domain-containing protein n=1 Tax=Bacteroides caecimuris TaxID=1796613 RepID=UPI0034E941E5